jgi:hypothetical protein
MGGDSVARLHLSTFTARADLGILRNAVVHAKLSMFDPTRPKARQGCKNGAATVSEFDLYCFAIDDDDDAENGSRNLPL